MEKKILLAFLLSFFLIGFVNAIDITNCTTISSAGIYDINSDLYLSSESYSNAPFCIWLNASDIVINGNNYTIYDDKNDGTDFSIIGQTFGNLWIRNITIKNLNMVVLYPNDEIDTGLDFYRLNDSFFENLNFVNFSFAGINLQNSNNIEIKNSNFNYNYIGITSNFCEKVFLNNIELGNPTPLGNSDYIDSGLSQIYANNIKLFNDDYGSILINNFNMSISESYYIWDGVLFFNQGNFTIVVDDISNPLPILANASSHLNMKGLSFINPKVLRNGVDCPIDVCTNLVYAGGTADFDVTGWSSYSLEESPSEEITNKFPNKITGSGTIYEVMDSSGAGLGKFFDYMKIALPVLLIGLAIVGIVLIVAFAIANQIKEQISRREV